MFWGDGHRVGGTPRHYRRARLSVDAARFEQEDVDGPSQSCQRLSVGCGGDNMFCQSSPQAVKGDRRGLFGGNCQSTPVMSKFHRARAVDAQAHFDFLLAGSGLIAWLESILLVEYSTEVQWYSRVSVARFRVYFDSVVGFFVSRNCHLPAPFIFTRPTMMSSALNRSARPPTLLQAA